MPEEESDDAHPFIRGRRIPRAPAPLSFGGFLGLDPSPNGRGWREAPGEGYRT